MVESQIEVLKKAQHTLPLSDAEQRLIEQQLKNCDAQINRERGKQYLANHDYDAAAAALTRANTFYKSWTLKLVIWGLRSAPRVVSYLANVRAKPLSPTTPK
jgi:hypothetical protein